ncbi:MAG: GspH/FimT family pseudopilin [Gammaproteobacteria bacterium]
MKTFSGFTLIELMITLAIAAILLTVGIPSFQAVFQSNRLATQANELIGAVNLARSEAIKRGANVTVRASTGGFQNGWCVHLNASCTGDDILRLFPAMNQMAVDAGGTTALVFNGQGQKATPAGEVTFTISPDDCTTGAANLSRAISIANTGRASVTAGVCP